jgi:hypothetical protein
MPHYKIAHQPPAHEPDLSPLHLINTLANFAAPALVVALLCAILPRILMRKGSRASHFFRCAAINCVAGLAALLAGLWYFGNDGKMATYAALVLAVASSQWLQMRKG